eukprot:gene20186-31043_t
MYQGATAVQTPASTVRPKGPEIPTDAKLAAQEQFLNRALFEESAKKGEANLLSPEKPALQDFQPPLDPPTPQEVDLRIQEI